MDLAFVKVVPGGNPTVLVLDPVPDVLRTDVAAWFMGPDGVGAEQVGFVDFRGEQIGLAMMGGEFCANACRALAAVVVASGRAASGQDVPVLSSGVASPVILRAEPGIRGWHAWVRAPGAVAVHRIGAEAVLVRLPGIVHLVIPQPLPEAPQEEAAAWRSRLQLDQEPAVGCIWVTPTHEGLCIAPLVWVRATQTVVLESGCGSGTLALAHAFPHMPWAHGVDVIQPSGQALRVEDRADGLWLGGPASITLQGKAYVPLEAEA